MFCKEREWDSAAFEPGKCARRAQQAFAWMEHELAMTGRVVYPRGMIGAGYPERDVTIATSHHDHVAKTPAAKSGPVGVEAK